MKKKNLLLSAWAITTMVSCGTPTNPSSSLSSSIMDSINTTESHDADYEAKHEAYELYVAEAKANNETPMTYEEWLESIRGEKGDKGEKGDDGKSAYEIYCESHPDYQGNEDQWLDDLVNGRLADKETHTVTFDTGDGSEVASQEVEEGQKASKPETPTRTGYIFVDWVDENGDHWVFNGFCITDDIVLTAVWQRETYTVTFTNNDGSVLYRTIAYYGDEVSYPYTAPAYANPDEQYTYVFAGWDKEDFTITGNTVFVAQYVYGHMYTFIDQEGNIIHQELVDKGVTPDYMSTIPEYTGTVETDSDGIEYDYFFAGWRIEAELPNATVVRAVFDKSTKGLRLTGNKGSDLSTIVSYSVTGYRGASKEVIIPSVYDGKPVTSIGEYAFYDFYDCSSLTSVEIPESVTSIGGGAFSRCSSLTSVTIPGSVTSIGESAFNGCSSLTSVEIPGSVASIGDYAFHNCSSLTSVTILDGVASIGDYAFTGCSSLTGALVIPESVTSIGQYAFWACSSLTSVTIPESVTSIGDGAFQYCPSLTGAIVIPEGVTSIGQYAFWGCSSLTSVTIPESVTSIGGGAFSGCSKLTSVIINEGVTSIGAEAFSGCSSLANVVIPSSVTSIGNSAFCDCSKLTNVTIPEGVLSIERRAFGYCPSLTSIVIPSSVTSIQGEAFDGCSSLTDIFYLGTESSLDYSDSRLRYYSETKPESNYGSYWHYVDGEPTVWQEED
ncbi:MAG: leucine-rich repeat protein [Bacilli bacterium]|nr:leucine-rich repeat protein [Bacilli bacterium]